MNQYLSKEAQKLLWLLLLTDAAFIFVHLLHKLTFYFLQRNDWLLYNSVFALETDLGIAESFQYVKEFWIVLLVSTLALRRAKSSYLAWATLFFYLLLDDAAQIHERLGKIIGGMWGTTPLWNIQPDDLGQFVVYLVIGAIFLLLIVFMFYGNDREFRTFSLQLGVILMALILCGVVFDLIPVRDLAWWLRGIETLIEDGGELLVMSVAVAYVYGVVGRDA